jgi:hypothetical protein
MVNLRAQGSPKMGLDRMMEEPGEGLIEEQVMQAKSGIVRGLKEGPGRDGYAQGAGQAGQGGAGQDDLHRHGADLSDRLIRLAQDRSRRRSTATVSSRSSQHRGTGPGQLHHQWPEVEG